MKIHRFEDFINEGILGGFLKSIGSAIAGKKSKLDSILSKIRESKMDFIKESNKIKREISDLYRSKKEQSFEIEMLKKSLNTYQIWKNREIDNLKKEAYEIIDDKSDLLSYFQSKLSRIEAEAAGEALKKAREYDSEGELKKLEDEFERISAIADRRAQDFSFTDPLSSSDPIVMDAEVEKVLSMSTGEFESHIQGSTSSELDELEKSLKKYTWSIQKLMDNSTANLRRQLGKARKEDDAYAESIIRKEIREIESSYRKEHKEAKDKIYKIEKLSKKRYATQEN